AATTRTAPIEAANHTEFVNTGYKTVDVSTTATAAVTVIRRFSVTWTHPQGPQSPQGPRDSQDPQNAPTPRNHRQNPPQAAAGQRAGATAARPKRAACSRSPWRPARPRPPGFPPFLRRPPGSIPPPTRRHQATGPSRRA